MPRQVLLKLSLFATAFAFIVIILGAFTRLVDAGLGCPDWPGCYGHLLWPVTDSDVAVAQVRFPDAPVEHDKTWPEMVHRYLATGIGLIILAMFAFTLVGRKLESSSMPIRHVSALVVLVILQGAFGAWTVTLKLWPQVVTAHLLGGFATLSLIWLLVQRLSPWRWHVPSAQSRQLLALKPLAVVVLVAVIAQITLGGWTSTNYAAMACPDLPKCHGQWWPKADFLQGFNIFQEVGPNYLGGLLDNHARTAIHLTHRIGAVVVSLLTLYFCIRLFLSSFSPARQWAIALLFVLCVQVLLGLSNIHWLLPLPVAVSHNAVGAVLLLVLVSLNHRLRTAVHV